MRTNEQSLPPRHTLHKRIELFRHDNGELGVHCERCDKVTVAGKPWCCGWAKMMYWANFYGSFRRAA